MSEGIQFKEYNTLRVDALKQGCDFARGRDGLLVLDNRRGTRCKFATVEAARLALLNDLFFKPVKE